MKIIQITATYSTKDEMEMIFGLGEDNKVYFWDMDTERWVLAIV